MRRLAALWVVLLVLVAGGTCRAERRPEPDPDPTGPAPPPTLVSAAEERTSTLPAAGMRPFLVEFGSADAGYAVLTRCDEGTCQVALFVTLDGGRTWVRRTLPFDAGTEVMADVAGPGTVAVRIAPHGWYVSTDTGRTFTRYPADVEPLRMGGPVQIHCPGPEGCTPQVVLVDGDSGRPTPTRPPLPGRLVAATRLADGRIAVASKEGDQPHTAFSADGGVTWQRFDVPGTAPAGFMYFTANKGDVWLATNDREAGGLTVWRLQSGGWTPVRMVLPSGQPDRVQPIVAAAGDRTLVVGGTVEPGYLVDGARFEPLPFPIRPQGIQVLADGTLTGAGGRGDTAFLSTGTGTQRRWIMVVVRADG